MMLPLAMMEYGTVLYSSTVGHHNQLGLKGMDDSEQGIVCK